MDLRLVLAGTFGREVKELDDVFPVIQNKIFKYLRSPQEIGCPTDSPQNFETTPATFPESGFFWTDWWPFRRKGSPR
jgi:hypothetical protein